MFSTTTARKVASLGAGIAVRGMTMAVAAPTVLPTSGVTASADRISGDAAARDGSAIQQRDSSKPFYLSKQLGDDAHKFADETHTDYQEKDTTERMRLAEHLIPFLAIAATATAVGSLLYKDEIHEALEFLRSFKDFRRTAKRKIDSIDSVDHQLQSDDLESSNNQASVGPPADSSKQKQSISAVETNLVPMEDDTGIMILSGTANSQLAHEVCAHLNVALGRMKLGRFADGEISLDLLDPVRSKDVYIFQSVPPASSGFSVHSTMMELFLAVSATRRANAERITAILPYMAYSRQDEVNPVFPTPLAVADVCKLLHTLGCDRVLFLDVHGGRTMGYFPEPIPVTNLVPHGLAVKYLQRKHLVRPVIVATDNNVGERAKAFWARMKDVCDECGIATVLSSRVERRHDPRLEVPIALKTTKAADPFAETETGTENQIFVGDVAGRDVVVVDDIIDSGTRVSNAVAACKNAGANRVFAYCTHGVLSKGAVDSLEKSGAEEVLITNSIELPPNVYSSKIKILNVSKLVAEVVKRFHAETSRDAEQKPLGALYRDPAYEKEAIDEAHKQ